jgi:hypothetical protein
VPIDFFKHGTGRRWVGAKLKATETRAQESERVGKLAQVVVESEHQHHWAFATEPVSIPFSDYYVERIRHGELIAADAATAGRAGVKLAPFAEVLAAAKAKAVADYDAQHGTGAWLANNEPIITTSAPEASSETTAPKKARKE